WTLAAVYFVREVGMGPLELVLVGTALEVAYFVFEVPTGVVADMVSRRASIVVAMVLMGAGFVLTAAVADVRVVLAAAALMGFGWTFRSGAEDAWLADEVGPERMARSYQRGAQVARALSLVGIGGAVGLGLVDLRLPIVVAGALLVALAVVLALFMPVEIGIPELAGLDPIVWFGILNAGTLLLALAVAQPLVRRFERAGTRTMARTLLGLDAALIAGTLTFAFAGSFGLAVAALWAIGVARELSSPVFSTWLNASIDDSRVRATVISITNLGDSAGEWGGGPALGAIGSAFGIRAALAAGAAVLSPALWLYTRALRHEGDETELAEFPVGAEAGSG
ncbi:MAG: hypothetical protein ACRDOG_04090, partial [Gaiellaceae bacterium]